MTGERGIGVGDGRIDERDGGVAGDGGVGGVGLDGGVGGENGTNNESSIYLDDIKEPHFQIIIWNGHLFGDLNTRFTTVSFKPLVSSNDKDSDNFLPCFCWLDLQTFEKKTQFSESITRISSYICLTKVLWWIK